jgi:glutaminyl-peptide cyclotransferase
VTPRPYALRWPVLAGVVVAAIAAALIYSLTTGGAPRGLPETGTAERLRVEVLATFPHDPDAFTQGLELRDGLLYESTGRYGRSDVRVTDLETGAVLRRVPLPDEFFGEGLTLVGDHVWQLTWQEQVALRRDRESLAERDRVAYDGQGWGLCHDEPGGRLVMSDGSAELTFRDPETFAVRGTVRVRHGDLPVERLNELECVGGVVWANVWLTDEIVRIDPSTGAVTAVVDASGLLPADQRPGVDVLNGIAAVPGTDTFVITGKLWPTVFHVRFVPQS